MAPRNKDNEQEEFGLLFDQVNRYGTTYWEARPVRITDRSLSSLGIRNFGGFGYGDHQKAMDGLEISVMEFDSRDEGWSTTRPDIKYRDVTGGIYDFEPKVALLRKVAKALEKYEEQDGAPANFGQYVARVGRAIGAGAIVVYAGRPEHRASSYDLNSYIALSLGQGADHIARAIRDWADTKNQGKAAA